MKLKTLKSAFPQTLPVLAGYLFLGAAYGIYGRANGVSALYIIAMCFIVFGGSLQFVAVEMLISPFAPLQAMIMALLIQARHVFYGISMLEKYRNTGLKKPYLIFGLSDETFSVNYSAKIPSDVDKGSFMLCVTALDQLYWICGAIVGTLVGSLASFNTDDVSFVMTAMFVVILFEQIEKKENIPSAITGLVVPAICLAFFGSQSFLIPSMACIVLFLFLFKKPFKIAGGES